MDELITLSEAAKLIPGATKATLLRRARQGLLRVSRVGRNYTTTRTDLDAMIEACRVKTTPTPRALEIDRQRQLDAASSALDQTIKELREKIAADRAEKRRLRRHKPI